MPHLCEECGLACLSGRYGSGQYAKSFYCGVCWSSFTHAISWKALSQQAEKHGIECHREDRSNPFWCPHCKVHLNTGTVEIHCNSSSHKRNLEFTLSKDEPMASSKRKADSLTPGVIKKTKTDDQTGIPSHATVASNPNVAAKPVQADSGALQSQPSVGQSSAITGRPTPRGTVLQTMANKLPQADKTVRSQGQSSAGQNDKTTMSLQCKTEHLSLSTATTPKADPPDLVDLTADGSISSVGAPAQIHTSAVAPPPPLPPWSFPPLPPSQALLSPVLSTPAPSLQATAVMPPPGGMCAAARTSPTPDPSSFTEMYWEFLASNNPLTTDDWQPFQEAASQDIERAFAALQGSNPQDGDSKLSLSINGFTYSIDFATMTQKNMQSGRCRRIRRSQRAGKHALQILKKQEEQLKESAVQKSRLQAQLAAARNAVEDLKVESDVKQRAFEQEKKRNAEHMQKQDQELRDAKTSMSSLQDQVQDLEHLFKVAKATAKTFNEKQRAFEQEKKRNAEHIQRQDQELRDAKTSVSSLQDRVQELDNLLKVAKASAKTFNDRSQSQLHQEESWRSESQESLQELLPLNIPDISMIEQLLQGTSHRGPWSRCDCMSRAKVTRVEKVHNVKMWKMYKERREHVRRDLQDDIPQGVNVDTKLTELLEAAFPWIKLDASLNEVLLFHGTKSKNIAEIAKTGFDARLSAPGCMYGEGVYFAEKSCKCLQYCHETTAADEKCMILARVLIGDPYYAKGPMQIKIPPRRDEQDISKGRHTSVVANVGTSKGMPPPFGPGRFGMGGVLGPVAGQGSQEHREYVIFDGQLAYPEFVIYFKV